jgi:CheY-like chemotaxis protein
MPMILVVDDSSNERNGLCRLLERAGYEVRSAADGVEALEKIQEHQFDLLLVDIWMPRMNGLELLALLPDESRPPVVVITGEESIEVLLGALREKAYLFVCKPVNPAELLQIVKSTLDSSCNVDPIEVICAEPNWVELRFPCEMQAADRVEQVLNQLNYSVPSEIKQSLKMALHELLMNAVKWGGRTGPEAHAQIDYLRTRKFILCRIADPGPGSDSREISVSSSPDFPSSTAVSGRSKGRESARAEGFGIRLAKSLVDELVFNESRNEVTVVKYLN